MKVCLYYENLDLIKRSGIGRALEHQLKACKSAGVDVTLDPNDNYDILHINTIGLKSLSTIKKARNKNCKVIYHAHSTEEDFRNSFIFSNLISPLFKKYLTLCYSKADIIITPTSYSKKLLERYNLKLPIFNVSNGIDENRFKYDENKINKFKEYFEIDENEKVIISVGLYLERKGIKDFVEIAKRFPNIKFIWFGYTPLYLIPIKIRKLIKNHPKNVYFPGYIKGDIIEGAYSGADCFLFLSYEETEGIVVLEALSSKQCVVVRDIGVYDDWLKDKVNCFKGKNNIEFESILNQVLNNSNLSIKEEGKKVSDIRNLDNIGKKLKEIYEKISIL